MTRLRRGTGRPNLSREETELFFRRERGQKGKKSCSLLLPVAPVAQRYHVTSDKLG